MPFRDCNSFDDVLQTENEVVFNMSLDDIDSVNEEELI